MAKDIKPCSGAGFWFPGNPDALKKEVQQFLDNAPDTTIDGTVQAIISPHAGYRYCGDVMATVFKTVKGKSYDRVIILAFSHSYPIQGFSVLKVDGYETPLGTIPMDVEIRDKLLESRLASSVTAAHAREHSAENQLPFLQVVLEPGWKMISIFAGDNALRCEQDDMGAP